MAKFIPIILPQPGEDLRTWARQLTSQLQSLTAQLSSVLANIEATGGGGGTPTPGGTTTPVKTPDGTTVLDVQGYYIDGLGRVIVDATGLHVYDLVGFQVIDGPNVYINTEHLVENAVKTAQLANDAVTYEKFFPDLVPIKIVDTLPNPVGYTGPGVVWLSTDLKLYRHAGTAWTSAVPAVDITGQLTNAQLESIAAAKLTGQIVETQIADDSISTPKLAAGSVSTAKLAAGAVVADTLAANAVTAVKLAAGAVEADKIAANAVTTSKLDANAVTTEKLDALAVTAGKLAAGSVVAGKLAANAIVANDGVIGTAAIADAQIIDLNANKITAGSIAAERMEANIVTALNGKFATLSALASSLGVVQILSGGALFTQGATAYATGTGVWMGQDGGVYKWRAGNPAGARIQWTGSALEVYNSSNQLTIASGNVDWAGITGTGKPENGATVGADWSLNLTNRPGDEDILNAGSNLILNPDLRNSPAGEVTTAKGWSFNANSGAFYYRGVLQDSANGPPFDSSAPMFYTNSTGTDGQVSWITDEYIPVGADRNYTVSAWLSRYSGNPAAYLGVICYDAAYTSLGYLYPAGLTHLNSTTLSASWERRYGVFGPGYTAFPAETKFVRVVWWGTYLSIGATLATRFCFNEGVVPSRSVVPLDSSLINKINPITPSNVTTYIANAAIGNAQIANAAITTAQIANAAITTAKIGDAQIDTLKIGTNAVSASAIASGTSITVVVPDGGAQVHVIANVVFNQSLKSGDAIMNVNLLRNGSPLITQKCNLGGLFYSGAILYAHLGSNSLSHYSFFSAGSHTFTVTSDATILSCVIHAFMLKR